VCRKHFNGFLKVSSISLFPASAVDADERGKWSATVLWPSQVQLQIRAVSVTVDQVSFDDDIRWLARLSRLSPRNLRERNEQQSKRQQCPQEPIAFHLLVLTKQKEPTPAVILVHNIELSGVIYKS
jgi:hypothetical protein